jgi:hypothetical protein
LAIAQNTAAISFPPCGVVGDTITHFGIGLGSAGSGQLLGYGTIGPGPAFGFSCTSSSPGILTIPGASLAANQRLSAYPAGGFDSLPVGLGEGIVYYVGTALGIAVTLSTTPANANPVNTTTGGSGISIVQNPLVVSTLIAPVFAPNALSIYLN